MKSSFLGFFLTFLLCLVSFSQERNSIPKNYPNPFNPLNETTTIEYSLSKDQNVQVVIFDLGNHIVWKHKYSPGKNGGKEGINKIIWDGKNRSGELVENGVYFCQIFLEQIKGKKFMLNHSELIKIAVLKDEK